MQPRYLEIAQYLILVDGRLFMLFPRRPFSDLYIKLPLHPDSFTYTDFVKY